MKKTFSLKEDCKLEDIMALNPKVLIIFSTFLDYAVNNNLPVKVTSIFSDRENIISQSKTHEEFRAIDVSLNGWDEKNIEKVVKLINVKHKEIAAISASDYVPRAIVTHNVGYGFHAHLQCRR